VKTTRPPTETALFLVAASFYKPYSSNQFLCRPRTAFGRLAACRNVTVPANRLHAVGPVPRCRKSRPAAH
jgi:hypothetical protein